MMIVFHSFATFFFLKQIFIYTFLSSITYVSCIVEFLSFLQQLQIKAYALQ